MWRHAPAALSAARRTAGVALAEAVGAVLVDLGFPAGVFEVGLGRRPAGVATKPRSSSTVMRWPSTRAASTRSSTGWRPIPANRPARSPGSRRAASCRASPWRSRASSPRPTRPRSSSSTRSTPGSAAAAPTRSGAACGRSPAATRSCASPTCHRSRRTPTRTTGSPSASATGARSPRSSRLDREGRIVELAQMLGGEVGGSATLASARELLDRAESWRGGAVRAG